MRRLLVGACAALFLMAAAAPGLAAEHVAPEYVSSEPEEGATVHEAPEQVEVEFSEPLDESSSLAVVDDCGRQLDDGSTEVSGNSMSIGIELTPSGDYHVEYLARGIEGLTGETEGHFLFTVHAGKPCDGKSDHGHHGDDGDNEKGHDGHNKKDQHGTPHDGEHGADHEADRSGSGAEHTDHTMGTTGAMHTDHKANNKHGKGKHDAHARHSNEPKENGVAAPGDVPGITSSDTARELLARADSGALLAALALCAALGILGGVILRSSARAVRTR